MLTGFLKLKVSVILHNTHTKMILMWYHGICSHSFVLSFVDQGYAYPPPPVQQQTTTNVAVSSLCICMYVYDCCMWVYQVLRSPPVYITQTFYHIDVIYGLRDGRTHTWSHIRDGQY